MIKGRDGNSSSLMDEVPRGIRRRLLSKARKKNNRFAEHIYQGKWDSLEMLKVMKEDMNRVAASNPEAREGIFKKNGRLTGMGLSITRTRILHHAVEHLWEAWGDAGANLPQGDKLIMQQVGVMGYHSGSEKDTGVSMVTGLFIVCRASQYHMIQQWIQYQGTHNSGIAPYANLSLKDCMEYIKPTIAQHARILDHERVARMFGIEKKSIPAIIAHDTRGSYQKNPLYSVRRVKISEAKNSLGWGSGELL